MDYSPPGSSVHGILEASIWECVAIPFSRDLPDPGIEPGFLHYQEILYCLSHFDGSLPSTLGHLYLELGQMAIESVSRKNFQHLELLLHQSNSASLKRNFCLYLKQTLSSPCPEPFFFFFLAVLSLHCCLSRVVVSRTTP